MKRKQYDEVEIATACLCVAILVMTLFRLWG